MIYSFAERTPQFDQTNFIAHSADVIGSVILGEHASIWFQCVLRGDNDVITIGKNSNIQDASVLHVDPGYPLTIGENVTVGHKVMLHGCSVGDNSLIGMNAVVLNGAKIGSHCIVGAGALITENTVVPDGTMALGSPAKVFKPLSDKVKNSLAKGAEHYVENSQKFMRDLSLIDA
jgi:carbonic anhydrase/acetyltransferase-like protein (isoleucine patch superfamily)